MITRNQLSMVDIFSDCQEILDLTKLQDQLGQNRKLPQVNGS